jgi:hypothetical protein
MVASRELERSRAAHMPEQCMHVVGDDSPEPRRRDPRVLTDLPDEVFFFNSSGVLYASSD